MTSSEPQVVAPHILFSFRHDSCEHVHLVLVHFENKEDAESPNYSSSVPHRIVSCSTTKLARKGKNQQTNFTPSSSSLLSKL
jgi:hypothetical protein